MQVARLILITLCSVLAIKHGMAQQVAFGYDHVLTLDSQGEVRCWGDLEQRYHSSSGWHNVYLTTPSIVTSTNIIAIAAGSQHNLALSEDMKIYAWGNRRYGQAEVPTSINNYITAIAAGRGHSLALREDGRVFAWGANTEGQCDIPEGINNVVAITAGHNSSAAIMKNGRAVCWGGAKGVTDYLPADIVEISIGRKTLFALTSSGVVHAWKFIEDTQNSSKKIVPTETRVPSELQGKKVIDIAAGSNHALALIDDGTVVAWGENRRFQAEVPYRLPSAIEIAAGYDNSAAILESKLMRIWGDDDNKKCEMFPWLTFKEPQRNSRLFPKSEGTGTNDTNSDSKCTTEQENLPPILVIEESSLTLNDTSTLIANSSNNAIDAFEIFDVSMNVTNTGPGCGRDLALDIHINGDTSGLSWISPLFIDDIPPGETIEVHYPFKSGENTKDGSINIAFEIIDPKGFNSDVTSIIAETRQFKSPKVEISDWSAEPRIWKPNSTIGLDVMIQNTGFGTAEAVEVKLQTPDLVNCYSSNTSISYEYLEPGESQLIHYDFLIPRTFNNQQVQVSLEITEKHGEYGLVWNQDFPFQSTSKANSVIIQAEESVQRSTIELASINKKNSSNSDIQFNQVPKDVIVETVAVVPVDGKDCSGQTISGQDIASFTEGSLLGLYNVVERRNLERVLDEQRLALSGVLYEKSAVEAGCNVGAQGIIFTEYGCLTGQETIQLKLVDCQTSELYWSATGVNATAQETLDKVRQELEGQ